MSNGVHYSGLERSAGRPRSEASRISLLRAAYSFLESHAFSEISPLHIARKAGVSTATIYRWWPDKEALLLEAFLYHTTQELTLSIRDSPLERLRHDVLGFSRLLIGAHGVIVARLLGATHSNERLKDEFLERFPSPCCTKTRAAVGDAIREGQLPLQTNVDNFLDAIFGPLFFRLLISHEPIREPFAASVFDSVVRGTWSFAFPILTN